MGKGARENSAGRKVGGIPEMLNKRRREAPGANMFRGTPAFNPIPERSRAVPAPDIRVPGRFQTLPIENRGPVSDQPITRRPGIPQAQVPNWLGIGPTPNFVQTLIQNLARRNARRSV